MSEVGSEVSLIEVKDLTPFADVDEAQAEAMIADATATALRLAPCLEGAEAQVLAAAKAILRRVILRWVDTGVSGVVTQESHGPFQRTVSSRTPQGLFWPSEVTQLQNLCRDADSRGGAFTIRPSIAVASGVHGEMCSTSWGWPCSCGSDLNRGEGPIFGPEAGL